MPGFQNCLKTCIIGDIAEFDAGNLLICIKVDTSQKTRLDAIDESFPIAKHRFMVYRVG